MNLVTRLPQANISREFKHGSTYTCKTSSFLKLLFILFQVLLVLFYIREEVYIVRFWCRGMSNRVRK